MKGDIMKTWKQQSMDELVKTLCFWKLLAICKQRFNQKGIDLPSQVCRFCSGQDEIARKCPTYTIDEDGSKDVLREMAQLHAQALDRKKRMEEL